MRTLHLPDASKLGEEGRSMDIQNRFYRSSLLCAILSIAAAFYADASMGAHLSCRTGLHLQLASAELYSDTANAHEDIRQAMLQAGAEHKNVLLEFGGNWCVDCHLLELYFHDPGNASLLAANYVVVHVNVGEYDRNLDLARKYGIPLEKGVPALVVLDGAGHLLYAQRNREFENMRVLDSSAVTAFLLKWRPRPARRPTGTHRSGK
ncbi:MAG: thioredoxin family protein [Acidobacteriaceae bacterium]